MERNLNLQTAFDEREEKEEQKRKRSTKPAKKVSVKKIGKKMQRLMDIAKNTVLPEHYFTVWTEQDLDEMCEWLQGKEIIAVDTETMGTRPFFHEIVGISLYAPHRGFYIPLKHVDHVDEVPEFIVDENGVRHQSIIGVNYVKCLPKDLVAQKLRPILEDTTKKFIFHNCKFDMHVLYNWMGGIKVKPYFDTMIAQALLDENFPKKLKVMAEHYLKIPADQYHTLFENVTFDKVPILINPVDRTGNLACYYAAKDTELTYKMFEFQYSHLSRLPNLYRLMFEIEMPIAEIAVEAERHGIRIDVDYLENEVAPKLLQEAEELRKKIIAYTGDINLNSPSQLSQALYEKLGLPFVNKNKPTSTDAKTLEKLKNYHEVIPLIIEYRKKIKLITAFVEKLPKEIINGRIHANFNTIGTKTGRMSCSEPNLCGAA